MSSEPAPNQSTADAADVEQVEIEDELEQSYIDYAMSVIAGRSLPDVRDGLKPVHRRILYAMQEEGVTSNKAHRKSSSIVGETMGNFHPHGDKAIYDTLVGMAQPFSMRYPLVDGQGNFGSIDDDPPAAQRYTEARMAAVGEELLADIDKDTVDFSANYDDRLTEPDVLPAAFPNLLVSGTTGIAVGMSTKIPPHNIGEIIDATIHLINNPGADTTDLMEHVPGPDFPTGAQIVGRDSIYQAYKTGQGRLTVRANLHVEEGGRGGDSIVVTEIPYQENKARRIEKIADDVTDGTLEGVSDIRDESDRDGIRIVVDLKKGANTQVVKNQLIDDHLEKTFGVRILALVDGQPQILSLKDALNEYIDHRKEVVRRRSEFELDEAEQRAHILEGRLTALDNADDIVELIQDSASRDDAKAALRDEYDFSEDQANHIVRMQLGSLTSMEAGEIKDEYDDVQQRIERLEEILADERELLDVIIDELEDIKDTYGDDRRTEIVEDETSFTREDLIEQEDIALVVTDDDYIKRMPLSEFREQNRGGKGIIGVNPKEGDCVGRAYVANTHDTLLWFTDDGQVYETKGYKVPEMGRQSRGKNAVNLLDLSDGESITTVVNATEIEDASYLTMVTRNGTVKRTNMDEFSNILSTGIRAVSLEDDDQLADVLVTDGDQELFIGTEQGMVIRFEENDARAMGRSARGVNGISLTGDDQVAGAAIVDEDDEWLLTMTENGYGKRTDVGKYRTQSRNGKGLIDIDTGDRNGRVVGIETVGQDETLLLMSEDGQIMRTDLTDISTYGRNTMGVTVMDVDDSDRVVAMDSNEVIGDQEGADGDTTDGGDDASETTDNTDDDGSGEAADADVAVTEADD